LAPSTIDRTCGQILKRSLSSNKEGKTHWSLHRELFDLKCFALREWSETLRWGHTSWARGVKSWGEVMLLGRVVWNLEVRSCFLGAWCETLRWGHASWARGVKPWGEVMLLERVEWNLEVRSCFLSAWS
jgi:hypothetical protein